MAAMRIALRSRNRKKSYGEDDEKLQICHSVKEKINKKRKKHWWRRTWEMSH